MSHRVILCTAATLAFLNSQPGEFTAEEIRRLGSGFHCDNDWNDVALVCETLAARGFILQHDGERGHYTAWSRLPQSDEGGK